MRDFTQYDVIFLDIDDTIVSGFWTRLMHITWNVFRNNFISDILMTIQNFFNIYKPNIRLLHYIDSHPLIYVLTARKACRATKDMLRKIFTDRYVITYNELEEGGGLFSDAILEKDGLVVLVELGTDHVAEEKWACAAEVLNYISLVCETLPKSCIFDDNKEVRFIFGKNGQDAFDPTTLLEKEVG